MKKQQKIISFIFSLAIILSMFIPHNIIATETTANSFNESYISAIEIKETFDGLAPFDSNNDAGNDANDTNNIIRSFDNINYTLEYVTAIKTNNLISDAFLIAELTLPCASTVATFDMSTMTWMEDPVLVEKNGIQVLTGKRFLQNTASTNAIPGEGTLSIGIKVQAAQNGTKIQPSFKLYMEGNDLSESKQTTSKIITVSAAPKYDLRLAKQGYTDYLGYYNTNTGEHSKNKITDGKYGRMQAYSLGLMLYNDNSSKGMKGIELPQGTIEFDLILEEFISLENTGNVTQQAGYTPYLWDYKENEYHSNGHLNRTMLWGGEGNTGQATCMAPVNTGGGTAGCYNGGTWTITPIPGTINQYHVTISGYQFSPNFDFPIKYCSDSSTTIRHGANVGWFSSGFINVLCQFPENVQNLTNVYLSVKAENFKSKSTSGQTGLDVITGNNADTRAITLYPPGGMSKNILLYEPFDGPTLALNWSERGDSSRLRGQMLSVLQQITITSDYPMQAFDVLLKFDDKGYEIPEKPSDRYSDVNHAYASGSVGSYRIYYAAKPNKTGWASNQEMIDFTQEDLIYFETIEELNSKGYICVGVLQEGRGWIAPRGIETSINLRIKDTANINQTYAIVSNAREWEVNVTHTYSNYTYNNGYTLNSEGYPSGYPTPTRYCNTLYYTKTEYNKDGTMVVGTHEGGVLYGNTVLVKGYNATILKKITDKDRFGAIKTVYDMDANERTINYEIIAEAKADISGEKTNLYITDTLPKDLTYVSGSSYWNNISFEPTITKNPDGTTTLYWILSNVEIGKTLNPIKFTCTIGKAGTIDDVYNNQSVTNTVKINGDGDMRENLLRNGNVAEATFAVIKLNAVAISKSTSKPFINVGQNFDYSMKFANNAENKITNAKLYDILPYDGDTRGSKFSGYYKITSIIINFANAPKTFTDYQTNNHSLDYTASTAVRGGFNSISTFNNWSSLGTRNVDNINKTVTFTNIPENITALRFNFNLEGFEYIDIKMNITPVALNGKTQQEGDVYINDFYEFANDQVEAVYSNPCVVQVYGSLNITKIWQDDNNKYNTRPNSLAITIYQDENVYKTISLTPADLKDINKWNKIVRSVPFYNNVGQKYTYTIKEDEQNINLLKYYYPVETENYDQSSLTVTNYLVGLFLPDGFFDRKFLPNNLPEYKITVTKDIVNKNNQSPTTKDFEIMKLDPQATYQFPIVLKEMERILSAGPNSMVETYGTYTGNILNGIVTNKGDIVFSNIWPGKYEISEESVEYFKFVGIEEIGGADIINNDGASLIKENGKYYIILSGVTQNNEEITVKVTNKLEDFRPYEDKNIKDNLFNHN